MSGLHEALDDIAAEITPSDPPVERAMYRGRRKRYGRRLAAVAGTAGALALAAGAVAGFPAPASRPPSAPGAPGAVSPAAGVPLARPVLLESPAGSTTAYGDTREVSTATMRLFHRLTCYPTPVASIVADRWKATVGYTAAQWNAPGGEVVSCDAAGTRYVLGPAVVLSSQLASAAASQQQNNGQWVVNVTLNDAATAAFGRLTTSQFRLYYPNVTDNQDDAVLDSIAFVINGDVQSAPQTAGLITNGRLQLSGPQPNGFTESDARALAAYLTAQPR